MPEPREITVLLELEREQERRFAGLLTTAERDIDGTPDQPSAKDTFAHAIGAKQRMHDALSTLRAGGEPDRRTTASRYSRPTRVARSRPSRRTPRASATRSSRTSRRSMQAHSDRPRRGSGRRRSPTR